jgi:predicted AlkP superfamily pyrophosphatase or phosphodiesterase
MRSLVLMPALMLATHSPALTAPTPKPKLLVVISVDQFSAELFQRYRDRYSGGLRRLAGGIAFTGYQSHAATETCPGHSTILTGDHPTRTGIVANTWFDVKTGSSVYCVAVKGTADPEARGPQNLRVDTLGDWLKAVRPGARSFSVSGKDRAAIMLGGHHADAVYWWADGQGFRTSSYAGPAGPKVTAPATAFNRALFAKWRATPPALWPSQIGDDCAALERPYTFGKLSLSGSVPPSASEGVEAGPDFLARTDFQDQLRVSPIFDPLTLDFASRLIDVNRIGHGKSTDLLAISLSATDYVGHRYGNGGEEMCVQMHALDRALDAFLRKLDGLKIPYAVALTADHGGMDAAERAADHGIAAERINGGKLIGQLNEALEHDLGLSYEPIVGGDPQQLVINMPGDDPALRKQIQDRAIAWLSKRPEVAQIFTADEIAAIPLPIGKPADQLTIAERFRESFDRERSGDIQVALKQYASIGWPRTQGDTVAGHGTPWDYDRRVPILFWWPGIMADNRSDIVETVDIAPTLARMIGIRPPDVDGKCIDAVAGDCR